MNLVSGSSRVLAIALLTCVATLLGNAQTFTTTSYSVGADPIKLLRADVNDDGYPDLVTANSDGTVTILVNNKDKTFRRLDAVAGASGTGVVDVASGDFNKDGHTDLAVVTGDNLNVLYGHGDGTFAAPTTIATKSNASALDVADFNGDGRPDIVLAWHATDTSGNLHAHISIYSSTTTGFSAKDLGEVGAVADFANGESPYRITTMNTGDLNHDGRQDFAFGECCGGFDVEIGASYAMLHNADGTWTQVGVNGAIAREVRARDVDGDGATDLIIPWSGCHTPCTGVSVDTKISASGATSGFLPEPVANGESDFFASATAGDFISGASRMIAYSSVTSNYDTGYYGGMLSFAQRSGTAWTVAKATETGNVYYRWLHSADFDKDGVDDLAALPQDLNFTGPLNRVDVFMNKGASTGSCSVSTNRTVKICSPGATSTSPVHVLAGVRSDSGISAAQIYVDGVKVYQGAAGTTTVDQSLTMAAGSHKITVKGWDATGSFSSSVTVTVGSGGGTTCAAGANRTVHICAPTAGSTVTSPVQVLAAVRSDAGTSAAQVYIDGVKKYQGAAGTSLVNQSFSLAAGTHKFTVKGWDSVGSFSSSVSVTVK